MLRLSGGLPLLLFLQQRWCSSLLVEGNVEWEKGLSSPTDFGLCALFSTALWQMTFVGMAPGDLVAFYDK